MQTLKTTAIAAMLLFCLSLFIFSCGHKHEHPHEHETEHTEQSESHEGHSHEEGEVHSHEGHAHGEGAEFTSTYICPMHCEGSGSEDPGTCPACGMDYVALEEHVQDGHEH